MTDASLILLDHQILPDPRLKSLRLPTVLREHGKLAKQAAAEGLDHVPFLARLIELEMPGGVRHRPWTDGGTLANARQSKARTASTSRRSRP